MLYMYTIYIYIYILLLGWGNTSTTDAENCASAARWWDAKPSKPWRGNGPDGKPIFFIGQNSKLDVWVFINLCVKWNIDIAVWKSIRNSNTKITVSMIPRSRRDVFHLRNWTQIVLLSLQNRDIFHCEFSKVSQFLHRSWFPQQNPRLEQLS